jgi:hypothetical protein
MPGPADLEFAPLTKQGFQPFDLPFIFPLDLPEIRVTRRVDLFGDTG